MENKDKMQNEQFEEYVLRDWERWANRYFPVEEKLRNWEIHLAWVLKDNR